MRLDRQFKMYKDSMIKATERVFEHGRVLQGPEVKTLEHELSSMFCLKNAATVGSGTDALIYSLKACGIQPKAKIAVTSLSFVASASCIVHAGGIPVFIDVDDNFMTRQDILMDLIQKRSIDGIIAVHLYGQMMDLEEIYREAQKNGIFVIEDAAQCLGSTRYGNPPGKYSDATCISFDPTKVIGAYGSGGAVLTDNQDINEKIIKSRYHGHLGNRVYEEVGFNSQLATVQAAIILLKLKYLDEWQNRRTAIANSYFEAFQYIDSITLPNIMKGNVHNFHKYVLRIKDKRDAMTQYLRNKGIATSIHYSPPLHQQPCFNKYMSIQAPLTHVESIVPELLSLPIYPELKDEEVTYICDSLISFFNLS